MPIIRIEMFEGRTVEQKRACAEAVTKAWCDTCGGTPAMVHGGVHRCRQAGLGDGGQAGL